MYPKAFFESFWRSEIRDEVFVAMSFSPEFSDVWNKIVGPAIRSSDLRPRRIDMDKVSTSIMTEILDCVAHSRLIVVDISEDSKGVRNPNVMYELGLAHALRQPQEIVVIRSDSGRLVFDVASIRVHRYNRNNAAESKLLLRSLIAGALEEIDLTKSLLIEKAVRKMSPTTLGVLTNPRRDEAMNQPLSALYRDTYQWLMELGLVRSSISSKKGGVRFEWTEYGRACLDYIESKASTPADE